MLKNIKIYLEEMDSVHFYESAVWPKEMYHMLIMKKNVLHKNAFNVSKSVLLIVGANDILNFVDFLWKQQNLVQSTLK